MGRGRQCPPAGKHAFLPAFSSFLQQAVYFPGTPSHPRLAERQPVEDLFSQIPVSFREIFFPGAGQGAVLQHIAAKVNEWKVQLACQRAKKGVPGFKDARFFRVGVPGAAVVGGRG